MFGVLLIMVVILVVLLVESFLFEKTVITEIQPHLFAILIILLLLDAYMMAAVLLAGRISGT